MPFDAFDTPAADVLPQDTAQLIAAAADPAADMDEQRLLAFLFVAPRPCEALDRLLDLAA
ncbi:hypothetical protein Q0812_07210 [Brevundimonas sp. 2R-24]|uniref:Uncharacterized protein n=1 Tax=Peiella sedimenti TaxID=3061083 RepID=A0ABT8SKX8_9CAUL|nr:hypothetical protein [Caulobacteraceae bacterium XZ-24]